MLKSILRAVTSQPDAPAPIAEQIDPIDALLAEREAAAAGLTRFDPFGRAVSDAHAALETAKAELHAFLDAERQALAAWADAGEGEAPARDKARHAALVAAVEDAERDFSEAEAASRAIEPGRMKALAFLDAIGRRIDQHRADSIAAEALREAEQLDEFMTSATKRLARILACREALQEQGRAFAEGKSSERGAIYNGAAGRLANIPAAIQIRPSNQEIHSEAAAWRAKLKG